MKNFYFLLPVVFGVFSSGTLKSQNTEKSPELVAVLQKLERLGNENPAGKFPIDKLSDEEKSIFTSYEIKRNLEEAQNSPQINSFENRLITKAYGVDVRNSAFASVTISNPPTETVISAFTGSFYADDIASNGLLYAIDDADKTLYQINQDGTKVSIGALTNIVTGHSITGMSWNWTNNTMYVISNGGTAGAYVHNLYSISLTTGLATNLGTFGLPAELPIWIEIDNNGNAFYADIINDNLHSLNLATKTTSLIGPLGTNLQFAQDADFNRETNELYAAFYVGAANGQGRLAKINTSTGAGTIIGNFVPSTAGQTVEFACFSVANSIPAVFMATDDVKPQQSKIYPNPTNGIVNIESKGNISEATLYNMEGRFLQSKKSNMGKMQFDLSKYPPGVYHLKTTINGRAESSKIIKK